VTRSSPPVPPLAPRSRLDWPSPPPSRRRQRKRFLGTCQVARGQHDKQQHAGRDSSGCGHPHR
jgi:hypothetical protein